MKVSDILRVKGGTLFTVSPDHALSDAVDTMAERDIGSLVVMSQGALAGILTFREAAGARGHGVGGIRGHAGDEDGRDVASGRPGEHRFSRAYPRDR